jgi:hypothetical protein
MTHIPTTDLDFSDPELMEELTDEQLLDINGGSFWRDLNKAFNRALYGSGVGIQIVIPLGGGGGGGSQRPSSHQL